VEELTSLNTCFKVSEEEEEEEEEKARTRSRPLLSAALRCG
jgi:hypothetical protein